MFAKSLPVAGHRQEEESASTSNDHDDGDDDEDVEDSSLFYSPKFWKTKNTRHG